MAGETLVISTDKACPVAGPYSQAICVPAGGKTLYISGQLPATASGELLFSKPLAEQAKFCIANLEAILKAADPEATLKNIVKCVVFLTDMDNFAEVNKGYEEAFGGHKPARSCVAVKQLPKGSPVEIEAVAII